MRTRIAVSAPTAAWSLCFLLVAPATGYGQDAPPPEARTGVAFHACYDPAVGAVYLIRLPGLADRCLKSAHLEIVLRGATGNDSRAAAAPDGPAGGDLGGTYPDPLVVGLQGKPVAASAPSPGQALVYSGGKWRGVTPALTGDVTGGVNTTTVVKLQNQAIAATTPTAGQVLQWDGTGQAWAPKTPVTAHNQLTGLAADDHPQYVIVNAARSGGPGIALTGSSANAILASGAGTRMLWYPAKAAFRAGSVPGAQWDDGNVGVNSTAFGSGTQASGRYSTALGVDSHAGGEGASAMGFGTTANGLSSLALGFTTLASGNYSAALGSYASTNGMEGSFVWGDRSTLSMVSASAANEFTVRAAGGIRLRTSSNLSTGCSLLANGSTWQCPSSKKLKTDFADIDADTILARIRELPVQTWRYKAEDASIRHMGPYAEDFRAAFQLGTDSVTIGHIDLGGVSLAAAKALEARTRQLQSDLQVRDTALHAKMAELFFLLDAKERQISDLRASQDRDIAALREAKDRELEAVHLKLTELTRRLAKLEKGSY